MSIRRWSYLVSQNNDRTKTRDGFVVEVSRSGFVERTCHILKSNANNLASMGEMEELFDSECDIGLSKEMVLLSWNTVVMSIGIFRCDEQPGGSMGNMDGYTEFSARENLLSKSSNLFIKMSLCLPTSLLSVGNYASLRKGNWQIQ